MNPAVLDFATLRAITGYQTQPAVERCLKSQGIRYFFLRSTSAVQRNQWFTALNFPRAATGEPATARVLLGIFHTVLRPESITPPPAPHKTAQHPPAPASVAPR